MTVATRLPQPVHEKDDAHKAPGDLELVRGFLSLHDHEPGDTTSLEPSLESVGWWLTSTGLVEATDRPPRDQDLAWALRVRDALTAKVWENMGEPRDAEADALLNRAAEETGLRVCFGCEEGEPIHVEASGVRGAIGRLLGTVFLAELDGTWDRLRLCNEPTCRAAFFDGSKNHSGKWCSMSTCGNRNKVRAFRERQAAG
jgi:CGNR zinc finger